MILSSSPGFMPPSFSMSLIGPPPTHVPHRSIEPSGMRGAGALALVASGVVPPARNGTSASGFCVCATSGSAIATPRRTNNFFMLCSRRVRCAEPGLRTWGGFRGADPPSGFREADPPSLLLLVGRAREERLAVRELDRVGDSPARVHAAGVTFDDHAVVRLHGLPRPPVALEDVRARHLEVPR